MRLNKYLARTGLASRRNCDEYIRQGQIKVNGEIITDFSFEVDNDDIVAFNKQILKPVLAPVVFAVHKPKGVVSTNQDTHGRKTVMDLVKSPERLFSIGRLDRDTTGIILVTNDGDLAYKLTHPKFKVEKKYYAVTEIDIANSKLKNVSKGIELDTGEIARCQIFRLDKQGKKLLWKIVITEGKNREIKRIFQALGSRVESLHRYEFAGINVENIKLGKYRRLRKSEFSMLTSLKDKK